jgi:hypothetical protein
MASLLFPLQFERQYSGPLDQDQVFTTTSARLTYLTNPLRYSGQIVTDLETNKAYQLNSAKDTWIELGGASTTFIQTNSANWQTAYAYVSANSVNLTATNIFSTNNLTVTNTVSAKYYQGTLIDWMTLIRGYKINPSILTTTGTGDVYTYVYSTSGTDKTYYRYVATDGSEDSFYGNFSGGILSNLITTKKIIL